MMYVSAVSKNDWHLCQWLFFKSFVSHAGLSWWSSLFEIMLTLFLTSDRPWSFLKHIHVTLVEFFLALYLWTNITSSTTTKNTYLIDTKEEDMIIDEGRNYRDKWNLLKNYLWTDHCGHIFSETVFLIRFTLQMCLFFFDNGKI